jgi:hypothetical protein
MQPEASAEERVRGIGDFDLFRLFGSFGGDLGVWVLEGGSKLFNRSTIYRINGQSNSSSIVWPTAAFLA